MVAAAQGALAALDFPVEGVAFKVADDFTVDMDLMHVARSIGQRVDGPAIGRQVEMRLPSRS